MAAVSSPNCALDEAMSLLQAGDLESALPVLRAAIQHAPADGHAHALLGICHAQQGNLDQAVKSLETAALLNPQDPAVEYNLANALFQVGRKEQAAWRLTRILEEDPEHQDARLLLTHIQRQQATIQAERRATGPVTPLTSPSQNVRRISERAAPGPFGPPASQAETNAPGVGLRFLRGLGWGLAYSQSWTVCSLFAAFAMSLFTTRVEQAVVAFLVMALLSALFHSAMGMLTGILAAALNADDDAGAWIGMSVGFLILLIGVRFGLLAMWAVVFYIFMGRWIGRSVATRIQAPVPG